MQELAAEDHFVNEKLMRIFFCIFCLVFQRERETDYFSWWASVCVYATEALRLSYSIFLSYWNFSPPLHHHPGTSLCDSYSQQIKVLSRMSLHYWEKLTKTLYRLDSNQKPGSRFLDLKLWNQILLEMCQNSDFPPSSSSSFSDLIICDSYFQQIRSFQECL